MNSWWVRFTLDVCRTYLTFSSLQLLITPKSLYIIENIKTALAAVDADFSHVVKLNIYLLARSHLPLLREVRDLYVNTQSPPASTLVEVRSLAQEEFLLEVEAIASLPA